MSEQFEFFEIPSPCIRVCQTNEKGICMGCFRNRAERFEWLNYNNTQKREVIRLTKQRYARYVRSKKAAMQQSNVPSLNQIVVDQLPLFDEE
ncbi:DUF1289 domain-containing protein [Thorsellia kenyensis]|uniref:DUF1289 domain-containing protein n=1 Tax=Thorsellia kenyensis TaxID=1549888 RepID=A0ABV6CC16_9GAMM